MCLRLTYRVIPAESIQMYKCQLKRQDLWKNIRLGISIKLNLYSFVWKGFRLQTKSSQIMRNHRGGKKIAGNLMMNGAIAIPPRLLLFCSLSSLLTYLVPTRPIIERGARKKEKREKKKKERKKKTPWKSNTLPFPRLHFWCQEHNL